MRGISRIVGPLVALALLAPAAGAASIFSDDDEDGFGSMFGGGLFGSGDSRRGSGGGSSSSGSGGFERVELSDGRVVSIDSDAYQLLRQLKGNNLSDEDILPFASVEECMLKVDERIVSTDCDDVERQERRATRALDRADSRDFRRSSADDDNRSRWSLTLGLGRSMFS